MRTIDVKRELGHEIVTREHGARLRELVASALEEGPIVVDSSGLQIASVSFFDAAFGQLALSSGRGVLDANVTFRNLDPFDDALLNDILTSRSRGAEKRGRAGGPGSRSAAEKTTRSKAAGRLHGKSSAPKAPTRQRAIRGGS